MKKRSISLFVVLSVLCAMMIMPMHVNAEFVDAGEFPCLETFDGYTEGPIGWAWPWYPSNIWEGGELKGNPQYSEAAAYGDSDLGLELFINKSGEYSVVHELEAKNPPATYPPDPRQPATLDETKSYRFSFMAKKNAEFTDGFIRMILTQAEHPWGEICYYDPILTTDWKCFSFVVGPADVPYVFKETRVTNWDPYTAHDVSFDYETIPLLATEWLAARFGIWWWGGTPAPDARVYIDNLKLEEFSPENAPDSGELINDVGFEKIPLYEGQPVHAGSFAGGDAPYPGLDNWTFWDNLGLDGEGQPILSGNGSAVYTAEAKTDGYYGVKLFGHNDPPNANGTQLNYKIRDFDTTKIYRIKFSAANDSLSHLVQFAPVSEGYEKLFTPMFIETGAHDYSFLIAPKGSIVSGIPGAIEYDASKVIDGADADGTAGVTLQFTAMSGATLHLDDFSMEIVEPEDLNMVVTQCLVNIFDDTELTASVKLMNATGVAINDSILLGAIYDAERPLDCVVEGTGKSLEVDLPRIRRRASRK